MKLKNITCKETDVKLITYHEPNLYISISFEIYQNEVQFN